MAVPGFSGSDGGIGKIISSVAKDELSYSILSNKYSIPLDISYFINNVCNLRCKHCYVAYEENKSALSVEEWKRVFDELVSMGALTFGNVGKEPTLTWNETRELLYYFREKRQFIPKIRFGLVTNGTLFDRFKIEDLERIQPDYIDVSLDGTKDAHDYIRGTGNYDRTTNNLKILSQYKIISKIFIIFTIMKTNIFSMPDVVDIIYHIGIRNILFSPYVTLDKTDELYLPDEVIVKELEKLISGKLIDFHKYDGFNIYIKNDFSTTFGVMEKLAHKGIIDKNNLFIDEYGVIFNRYTFDGNNVYFNYLPWDTSFVQAIRISHDGYVSNCFDMFFTKYPERTIGNVRTHSIREILQPDISLLTAVNL